MKGNTGQNFIANLRTELQPKAGHWEGNHLRQKAWPVSTVRVWEELRAQEREGSTATYDTRLRLPRATTQLPQNHRTSTNTEALFPLRLPWVHRWHHPPPRCPAHQPACRPWLLFVLIPHPGQLQVLLLLCPNSPGPGQPLDTLTVLKRKPTSLPRAHEAPFSFHQ